MIECQGGSVRITRLSAVMVVALLLSLSSVAAAKGSKEAARAAFKQATQHFNLGEYGDALDAFKEAYRNFEDPVFLFNIAQCQRMLGNKQEAVRGYRTFLREAPDAPNRAEVQALVSNLEQQLRTEEAAQHTPPQGTEPPSRSATPAPAVPEAGVVASPAATHERPVYRKWWLWTAVGVAAAGLAVGLGVGLTRGGTSYPQSSFTDGTVRF
jgi:tetratricopeptide (TPR) repeat protein